MLYTSYFANIRNLPEDIVPISICAKAPNGYKGLQYKTLAPKYGFFMKWKETHDNDYYIKHYKEEVTNNLNFENVLKDLYKLSNGKDFCLVCYEKPTDFCHRHLVANWFIENNIEIKEFKKD